jgi:Deoxyribonuclease NucA/NucB
MDIGDWDDGQWLRWNFRSDERVATQQPEKVLRNKFTLSGDATDDFGRTAVLIGQTEPGFRCDSATYFRYEPRSCIFTDVLPRLPHPYGAGFDEVVTHIKGADERPDLTHPFLAGKSIPGRWPTDSRALHRVPYQGAIWTTNRNAKDRACRTLPPRLPGQDCDEFPFASTKEGAGLGDGNFSVKYLNNEQNRRSGRTLRDYYRWDRILYEQSPGDGTVLDEFWVNVP